MSGYSDPDRYPSMKAERRLTLGVQAARYGIGIFLFGVSGLVAGGLYGLDDITFLRDHYVIVATGCIALGALLFAFGWKRPD